MADCRGLAGPYGSDFVFVRGRQVVCQRMGRASTAAEGTHDENVPRGRRGQVAVEWLMVAGILTAVAIFLTAIIQPTVVTVVRSLARSLRTPGL